jgi:excisionase family DNA binding protein
MSYTTGLTAAMNLREKSRISRKQSLTMPDKRVKKMAHGRQAAKPKPGILDVHGVAALLMVSADTVYELLKSGQMPGRKVGRKWLTTRNAVMRWVEESVAAEKVHRARQSSDTEVLRAIETGDRTSIAKALQSGIVRVKAA